jgi:hypothetical protein
VIAVVPSWIGVAAGALAAALLSACAGPGGVGRVEDGATSAARECLVFLGELDRVIDVSGARDAGEYRIPGFPFLRTDRFTASFRDEADDDARSRAWIARLRELDERARRFEIANLPEQAFPVMRSHDREATFAQARACGDLLAAELAGQPARRAEVARLAVVPDDYSTFRRVVGLYALTGMPFAASERRWERHTRKAFAEGRRLPPPANLVYQRYGPAGGPLPAAEALAAAREVLAAAPRDPLGIPQLDDAARERLFDAFAPTDEIATSAEYDRFGPLLWIDLRGLVMPGSERYWLDVEPTQPVVYRRLAFTRYGDAVLPQLVYTIWFSGRPMQDSGDLLGGRLDGLVWRVTLDPQGEPLLFDTVQPSGRFAMFFPTARLRARPPPESEPLAEWAFSPIDEPIEQWVGAGSALASVGLRVAAHTHQLVGVARPGTGWGEPSAANPPYRFVAADRLRALPLPGGGSRSVFGPDGIVPHTERFARYFFWPMGIESPGSMRQYGRQPTAFIGRRHFDDADLLERRFDWLDRPGAAAAAH